jgi:heterodisulfide reductase subunit C
MNNQDYFYEMGKASEGSSWNAINRNSHQLSDEEIITLYYRLRDEHIDSGAGHYFPNIKHLYATPFEREKDRREQQQWQKKQKVVSEVIDWYLEAKNKSCVWWLENHVIAKHALSSCMNCGACTALCPAAEFYDFSPRGIMTLVQEKNEEAIIELLKSETIWYCHQCGSCKTKCPRRNSLFGMISSLRQLSQIKGYHVESARGRQQYFGRHLWGGNLWNRACTLYFRNPIPEGHLDFGPRFKTFFNRQEEFMKRIGAHPDMNGPFTGRKVHPETLEELRKLWTAGGALFLWSLIEEAAQKQAAEMNLSIEEYHNKVKTEG